MSTRPLRVATAEVASLTFPAVKTATLAGSAPGEGGLFNGTKAFS